MFDFFGSSKHLDELYDDCLGSTRDRKSSGPWSTLTTSSVSISKSFLIFNINKDKKDAPAYIAFYGVTEYLKNGDTWYYGNAISNFPNEDSDDQNTYSTYIKVYHVKATDLVFKVEKPEEFIPLYKQYIMQPEEDDGRMESVDERV